jgi:sec-independent protein translocase protein TatA
VVGDLLQPTHLLFVLVVALLVLGPKRLPEAGRALGRGLRDFRSAISGEEPTERTIAPAEQPETSTATPVHQPVTSPEPSNSTAPDQSGTAEAVPPSEAATSAMRHDSAA